MLLSENKYDDDDDDDASLTVADELRKDWIDRQEYLYNRYSHWQKRSEKTINCLQKW